MMICALSATELKACVAAIQLCILDIWCGRVRKCVCFLAMTFHLVVCFEVTSTMMHIGTSASISLIVLLNGDYLMFRVSSTRENDWSRAELLHKCLTRCFDTSVWNLNFDTVGALRKILPCAMTATCWNLNTSPRSTGTVYLAIVRLWWLQMRITEQ
jgi:hypothetical protein